MTRFSKIINELEKAYPDARCMLDYTTDYGLLIAVMLSAQTTDKAVNKVTAKLFEAFPTLDELAKATYEEVYEYVKVLGLAKTKANNVISIAKALKENYAGKVPENFDDLISLPGVGRKTANVVLSELFNQDTFAVDTHVSRLAYRLGYAEENDSPLIIEYKLKDEMKKGESKKVHHLLIRHGREICKAKNPACVLCPIRKYCPSKI